MIFGLPKEPRDGVSGETVMFRSADEAQDKEKK